MQGLVTNDVRSWSSVLRSRGVSLEPGNLLLDSRKAPTEDGSWDLAVAVRRCRKRLKSDLTLTVMLTDTTSRASAGQRPLLLPLPV